MSDRWQQSKTLLLAALDLEPAERPGFLDHECGDDLDLRRDVECYLAAEDEVDTFIEAPLIDLLAARAPVSRTGQQLGAFRLEECLGHGGMGEVYRGRREDGAYQQVVAIKILKRGLDTTEVLRRFRQERQILADLDHPNIARLLDGGTTDDGLPYLVMELIDGTPIDRHCFEQGLPLNERLALFQTVCATVHAAHQSLVVHRDLKPDNILVTAAGVPVLLDFGVARLLDPEATATRGWTRTRAELRLMTPAWASPEQVTGARITTASDVYTLGALLYRLLTGERPLPIDQEGPQAVVRNIVELDPRPLSETVQDDGWDGDRAGFALEPKRLSQSLAGDLENIVRMAMQKDPERRYPSAAALAEDLRRHQAFEPVIARPDSRLYRTRRFVRRHRLGVATGALFLLMILGFGVAQRVQLRRTEVARDAAELARQQADALKDVLLITIERIDPSSQQARTARSEFDQILEQTQQVSPVARASLLNRMGLALLRLGFQEDAERMIAAAVAIHREMPDSDLRDLANLLNSQGLIHLEEAHPQAAIGLFRQALRLLEDAGEFQAERVKIQTNLATCLRQMGQYSEAEPIFREIVTLKKTLFGAEDVEYAIALNNLGDILIQLGRAAEAESLLRRSIAIRRIALGKDSLSVATPLSNLAFLLDGVGDHNAAIETYREALAVREHHFEPSNSKRIQSEIGLAFSLLGRGINTDLDEAKQRLTGAQARCASNDDCSDFTAAVINRHLAAVLLAQMKPIEAESHARQALEGFHSHFAKQRDHWRIADAESLLGHALLLQGRLDAARPLLLGSPGRIAATQGETSRYAREARRRAALLGELATMPSAQPLG